MPRFPMFFVPVAVSFADVEMTDAAVRRIRELVRKTEA